jgi:hypothetical protein
VVPTQVRGDTGIAIVTLSTSDGGPVPAGSIVCVGDVCKTVGAAISSAAADVSPVTLTFADLEPGTYPVTVTNAAPYADANEHMTVSGGETTRLSIVLEAASAPTTMPTEPGNATPITTVTVVPTHGSGGSGASSKPESPAGGNEISVKALPNTGSGSDTTASRFMLLLMAMLAVGAAATVAWRSRAR